MPESRRIRILPTEIANQIAAGEVVERPASVVKELVENSIDAGATRISIEVELGGRRLIKVVDDGHGIPRDEVPLAMLRHATSKLRDINDLEIVKTLGFRGEALASIASVSRLELLTKTDEEEVGTRIRIDGEADPEVSDAARPTGTTVEIRDLFFNTPARRKFLRSQPTENYHIASIVTHYSLAYPEIGFRLLNNGRESIRVAPAATLRERAFQLFGPDLVESLVPVIGDETALFRVSGFVSAPRERRTSRDAQYLFVNGRFVRDRVISSAVSEAYRAVLPHGVYPVAFLFVEIPLEEVDVNVHPSKTEVRFRRAEAVKEIIASSIRSSLRGAGIGKPVENIVQPALGKEIEDRSERYAVEEDREIAAAAGHAPGEALFEFNLRETQPQAPGEAETQVFVREAAVLRDELMTESRPDSGSGSTSLPPVDSAASVPKEMSVGALKPSEIRGMGQLHNSFLIATDKDGLLLIDQHVAHERILFDIFRRTESERRSAPQNLLTPIVIDLSPAQLESFEETARYLRELGFDISLMSGRSVAVKSVPAEIPMGDAENILAEVLETVDSTNRDRARDQVLDDIAATLACKAAIKINTPLSNEKIDWLIENLLLTNSPTTCPHGRPVVLRLTMKDIERRFHRS